jgi:hypothetical protein
MKMPGKGLGDMIKGLKGFGSKGGALDKVVGTLGKVAAGGPAGEGMLGKIGGKLLRGAGRGGVAGLALGGAQLLAPEGGMANNVLNSNAASGAAMGMMLGPMGALIGGGVGLAMDAYQHDWSSKSPAAPAQTPQQLAEIRGTETKKVEDSAESDNLDINQLILSQLQMSNQKLETVTKTLKDGNELYAMTEDEKKALMKPSYARLRNG